jgi:ribosome biogenesis protein UTP30
MKAVATTTVNTSKLDKDLIRKAVEALMKHHDATKNEKSLLGNDSLMYIQFGLNKIPESSSVKPRRVEIPHPLWKTNEDCVDDLQEPSVCLIVKEDSKEWVQELISSFPNEMGFIKKVLGLDSLRKKHGKFEQQRALIHRFDVFMADDRILPMLTKVLGKSFLESKKQPIPVSFSRKTSLPFMILKSLQSTFWFMSQGTCLTVKAATTSMSESHIIENINAICAEIPPKVPHQWANIRSISLKLARSTSLPIYNMAPLEIQRILALSGTKDHEANQTDADKDVMPVEKRAVEKKPVKSPLVSALLNQQKRLHSDSEIEAKKRKVSSTPSIESPTKKIRKSTGEKEKSTTPKDKSVVLKTSEENAKEKKDQMKESKKKDIKEKNDSSTKLQMKGDKIPFSKSLNMDVSKVEDTASKKKKPKLADESKVVKEQISSNEKATFMASEKYTGSKPGFVFKLGKEGLGYYVDVKPKVDPMILDALSRSGKVKRSQSSSSGRRKGNKSGR